MNYIIGLCKRHENWVSVLADLGYELQIIEQTIRTSSDEIVKPDLIATSNRLLHSLVLECKGGMTIDTDQLRRYSTLTLENLLRWVTVFASDNFNFDICISDFEENHLFLASMSRRFPMITFSKDKIFKTGIFKSDRLNDAFGESINLKGKIPPLSYYPFSEEDEDTYIAPFVLRGLVSIAIRNAKGGPSVFERSVITKNEIVKQIFHPVFDALSIQHQRRLREKVKEVIRWILAKEEIKEALGVIEQRRGYRIRQSLQTLEKESKKFLAYLEKQRPLIHFLPKNASKT